MCPRIGRHAGTVISIAIAASALLVACGSDDGKPSFGAYLECRTSDATTEPEDSLDYPFWLNFDPSSVGFEDGFYYGSNSVVTTEFRDCWYHMEAVKLASPSDETLIYPEARRPARGPHRDYDRSASASILCFGGPTIYANAQGFASGVADNLADAYFGLLYVEYSEGTGRLSIEFVSLAQPQYGFTLDYRNCQISGSLADLIRSSD